MAISARSRQELACLEYPACWTIAAASLQPLVSMSRSLCSSIARARLVSRQLWSVHTLWRLECLRELVDGRCDILSHAVACLSGSSTLIGSQKTSGRGSGCFRTHFAFRILLVILLALIAVPQSAAVTPSKKRHQHACTSMACSWTVLSNCYMLMCVSLWCLRVSAWRLISWAVDNYSRDMNNILCMCMSLCTVCVGVEATITGLWQHSLSKAHVFSSLQLRLAHHPSHNRVCFISHRWCHTDRQSPGLDAKDLLCLSCCQGVSTSDVDMYMCELLSTTRTLWYQWVSYKLPMGSNACSSIPRLYNEYTSKYFVMIKCCACLCLAWCFCQAGVNSSFFLETDYNAGNRTHATLLLLCWFFKKAMQRATKSSG